jgi:hypothetical protein
MRHEKEENLPSHLLSAANEHIRAQNDAARTEEEMRKTSFYQLYESFLFKYRLFQKELYNFESLYKFIQRTISKQS